METVLPVSEHRAQL